MALEGRLQEFGAAEALGLVAREEKTGRLSIGLASGEIVLYFERGRVIQAREPRPSAEDGFLALVKELRLLSPRRWKELAAWQRDHPDRDPVLGLLKQKMMARDDVQEWLEIHVQGVFDRILEASEGHFKFESTLTAPTFGVPLSLQPEFMIMEAGRRTDETKEHLHSDLPADGVPSIRPGQRPTSGQPIANQLLRLVDGRRTVREILRGTVIPDYELTSDLRGLVDQGACIVRIPGGRIEDPEDLSGSGSLGKTAVIVVAGAVVVGSILVGVRLWTGSFNLP